MANIYNEDDIDPSILDDKTVAVLGFGSQGHAHSLNLHESGVDVIVGLREDSSSRETAEEHGLTVMTPSEAVSNADIVSSLVPDQVQDQVYEDHIEPNLKEGGALMYAHGFSVHFEEVVPREDLDVYMIAPKGPGHLVRDVYKEGEGVPALLAVYQDKSGEAREIAKAYGLGIGSARAGLIETSFKEETETDLFGEQTTLCGGIVHLMQNAYETLTEEGYQSEIAYFEIMHEMKLIVDLFYVGGFSWMHHSVSDTAEYGSYAVGQDLFPDELKDNMEEILERVQNGEFAEEWLEENRQGRPNYKEMRKKYQELDIEKVGHRLRTLMPFIEEQVPPDHEE